MYILDADNFKGGRRQTMSVGDHELGEFSGFQEGRWVETNVTREMAADGTLSIRVRNLQGNAVISIIEWVAGE